MPCISVIVPMYNDEKFIADTIYCLRTQTFKYFECIIIDDCSTDDSVRVAKKAIDGDTRFSIVKHYVNSNPSGARNTGLMYASGDYILFLDADDILTRTSLTERYTIAVTNKYNNVAGSWSKHTTVDENQHSYDESKKIDQVIIFFESVLGENPFVMHSTLTRREIACGVGGFNERLKYGAEDYDFWLNILRHGFIYLPTNTVNAFYRNKKNSHIRKDSSGHLNVALQIYEKNNSFVKKNSFYSIANMKMACPAFFYAIERKAFFRIFRFLGMNIANGYESDIKNLARFVPNFYCGFPFDISPMTELMFGIQRVVGEHETMWNLQRNYSMTSNHYIAQFIKTTRENAEKASQNEVPESVDVYSAEWERQIDIVFIPHGVYHAETVRLLQPYLEKEHFSFVIADCSALHGDQGVRKSLSQGDLPYISFPQLCLGDFSPKCVAVFNDWDDAVTRPAIKAAKQTGIIALSIVEGVNDYDDVDTGRFRYAYKTSSHVITPCPFDMKYFDPQKQRIYEGAIPRIEKLAVEEKQHLYLPNTPIVINSNFSYNVLVDKRDDWVRSAVEACLELGKEYVISRHPFDLGDFSNYTVTKETMYDAIWHGSLFISRFGSGIIEAIAMNRPVIYYNPHGEKIDKFKDPMGAYYIANSKKELKTMITKTYKDINVLKRQWPDFLKIHAGYSSGDSIGAIQKVALIIKQILRSTKLPDQADRKKFGEYLAAHFHKSDAELFKNIKYLENWHGQTQTTDPID